MENRNEQSAMGIKRKNIPILESLKRNTIEE